MNPLDLLIVALAASRLTRLAVHDTITAPIRHWLWKRWPGHETTWGESEIQTNGTDSFGRQVGVVRGTNIDVFKIETLWFAVRPRFAGAVFECHWCTGIYVGVATFAAFWFYPVVVPYLAALAVAEVVGKLND